VASKTLTAKQAPLEVGDDWREFAPLKLLPTLEGAMQVFPVKGYHGSTVRDLAAAAGITLPTLYYYHGDKQNILVDLLSLGFDELLERMRRARTSTPPDPVSQLNCFVEVAVLHMIRRHGLAILEAEIRYLEPDNRASYLAKRRNLEDQLLSILQEGMETGDFHIEFPRDAGRAILGFIQAIATWYRPDGPLDAETIALRYQEMARRLVGVKH